MTWPTPSTRVRGALQLTGYSAYLHPAWDTRLIGIGQQADAVGHVGGIQVSLFDVSDLAAPAPVATFAIAGGHSAAEFDPHAFLYWPADGFVVVPLQTYNASGSPSGVLVLRATDSTLDQVGFISRARQPRRLWLWRSDQPVAGHRTDTMDHLRRRPDGE